MPRKSKEKAIADYVNLAWYNEKPENKESIANTLAGVVDNLRKRNSSRIDAYKKYLRIYGGKPTLDNCPGENQSYIDDDVLSLNIIESICDTRRARVCKNLPKLTFLTFGGTQEQQDRAKGLEKFVDGAFYESNAYKTASELFLDADIFGDGFAKVYTDSAGFHIERIFPWEILVDINDAFYGKPSCLYHTKYADKNILAAAYPEFAEEIHSASPASSNGLTEKWIIDPETTRIQVIEAWHLPSNADSNDGRHIICIDNCVILDEEWKRPRFPIAHLSLKKKRVGYWGTGIAEQLLGIQIEINELIDRIRESNALLGKTFVFVESGSKINIADLSNEIAAIAEFTGTPPIFSSPQVIPPEVFSHLNFLIGKAYELAGISQSYSSGQKDAGLNSGKALRTKYEVDNTRLSNVVENWEDYFKQLATVLIDEAVSANESGIKLKVKYKTQDAVSLIKWKEVNLDEDSYTIQQMPTNYLSNTPAYRIQEVSELLEMGAIQPGEVRNLLGFPDLEARKDRNAASYRLTLKHIEKMKSNRERVLPEPLQNLVQAIELTEAEIMDCLSRDADDEIVELLRQYVADCDALLTPPPVEPMGPVAPVEEGALQGEAMPPEALPPEAMPPEGAMPPEAMPPVVPQQ